MTDRRAEPGKSGGLKGKSDRRRKNKAARKARRVTRERTR